MAREPGIQEHRPRKHGKGRCSWIPGLDSGLGPAGRPGTTGLSVIIQTESLPRQILGPSGIAWSARSLLAIAFGSASRNTRPDSQIFLKIVWCRLVVCGRILVAQSP